MTADGVRVVVCEDSATYRSALVRAIEHGGDLRVVGSFETAEETLAALEGLSPDLVTMDLELPGMQGLDAVEEIMSARPTPVAVVSSHVTARSDVAGAALAAGAVDALAKDDLDLLDPDGLSASTLRRRLQVLSRAHVVRHPRAGLRARGGRAPRARTAAAIGICASTGGPQVIATLLRALPPGFPIPVLLVQHMTPGFLEGFGEWLQRTLPLPVRLGEDGGPLERGVTLAPPGAHLLLTADCRLRLDRDGVASGHRPSGDVLLGSLAEAFGRDAVGVVLTGMGRDGAAGAAAIVAAGGLAIAQDEHSSTIYGMPRAAAELCAAELMPPAEIASVLGRLRKAGS
jgi:two-component system, chemotaxis family, protein-glutamate methylesterase/glutaminase